ncbi:MAG TPA: cohesin domain-containing protein [Patescibacteria group bacterium]|nr:cohesin domain-containing protein [Patescibacteria group bacterium]
MEPTEKHHSALFFTAVFSLVVIIFAALIFALMTQVKKTTSPGASTQFVAPTTAPAVVQPGVIKLIPKDGKTSYRAGDTVTLRFIAHSAGDTVTGYDAVVRYDTDKMRFVKAASVNDDFQLFADKNQPSAPLFITGVKKLASTTPVVFSDTVIAELTFTVVKGAGAGAGEGSGFVTFNLDFIPGGTKDSNLINEKTQDILGRVEGVVIQVAP